MAAEPSLSAIRTGAVVAPAGCGKTQLIVEALRCHEATKPILVLTHTNAGVAALRGRLDRGRVATKQYRLATLDGWALRLLGTFPQRSGVSSEILRIENPRAHYPRLRMLAVTLLEDGHVDPIITASYDRLIVDEYQDCDVRQHDLVCALARLLDTVVLGDPMQSIFGFGGPMPDWHADVLGRFPLAVQLDTPWRWRNAGTERLGSWLLHARHELGAGRPIDLSASPPEVEWVQLDGTNDYARQIAAGKTSALTDGGSVLVVGDGRSPPSQRRFAAAIPGAVTVEAVDLRDLTTFAAGFDFEDEGAFASLIDFADDVMTGVGAAEFIKQVAGLHAGSTGNPPTEAERAALNFLAAPSPQAAARLLEQIGQQPGVRPHRPEVLRACFAALKACAGPEGITFETAAVAARERGRLVGRPLPQRAVGSTLLLKGLEADVAVILEADKLDSKNLYVAMTRGARRLVLCSRGTQLPS